MVPLAGLFSLTTIPWLGWSPARASPSEARGSQCWGKQGLLVHSIGTCQVGAQGAPCERAGAATAGDALTSFPQKQSPTEPGDHCATCLRDSWGPTGAALDRNSSSASAAFRLLLEILSPLWPLSFEADRRKMCPRASHKQRLGTNP